MEGEDEASRVQSSRHFRLEDFFLKIANTSRRKNDAAGESLKGRNYRRD